MFERTQSDVAAIAEGQLGLSRQMEEGYANLRREFNERVDPLAAAIRLLSQDTRELKTDVAELKTDVAELKTDVAELKVAVRQNSVDIRRVEDKLDEKADRSEFTNLNARVAVLEAG
jgi:septal ring factor EnvC (AmiA/AmiB activator)